MPRSKFVGPALVLCGLAGCVAPYPAGPPQIPYVALPGPTKTEAQFRQDDTTCRAAAVQLPPEPARTGATPAPTAPAGQSAAPPEPPGAAYLRCMAVRGNPIEPLADSRPPLFAYYQPYPLFVGYGDYYPFLFGGPFYGGFYGFGFYHGFGGYRGFGGYHGYGGYRGYGGYHGGGYGGYHGGYGGFQGGGFHGGRR